MHNYSSRARQGARPAATTELVANAKYGAKIFFNDSMIS